MGLLKFDRNQVKKIAFEAYEAGLSKIEISTALSPLASKSTINRLIAEAKKETLSRDGHAY